MLENRHTIKRWASSILSQRGAKSLLYYSWVGNYSGVLNELQAMDINDTEALKFGSEGFGATALHLAVWNMHHDVADLLLRYGATVFARSSIRRFTTLHLAVFNNDLIMVKKLLDAGAPVSIMDVHGETSLDWAIRYTKNESLIQLLVQVASFEPTWNVNALKSAIQLAIHVENTDAFNTLLKMLASLHPSWTGGTIL